MNASATRRSRARIGALVAALMLGVALGIALGTALGGRSPGSALGAAVAALVVAVVSALVAVFGSRAPRAAASVSTLEGSDAPGAAVDSGQSPAPPARPGPDAGDARSGALQQRIDELERRAEAEHRQRLNVELVSRGKDEFISLVVHDLRTPINAMVGWLHVMESGGTYPPETIRRAAAGLGKAVAQQRELVDSLLEAARVLRGDVSITPVPVDLEAVVERAVRSQAALAQSRGVGLRGAAPAAGTWIEADAARIERALQALLSVALRQAPGGAAVEIAVGQASGRATVTIREADGGGPGFARAFAAFASEERGTVMGSRSVDLILASRLVGLNGGRIRLVTQAGDPAAQRLELRFDPIGAPSQPRAADPEQLELPDLTGVRVLLVDDQAEMREVLVELLGERHALADAAQSAREAMAMYQRAPARYAIGIFDIAMPEEDGIDLVRRLRAWEAETGRSRMPIAALTAHADAGTRDRALSAGFDRFLAKPLRPEQLFTAIAELARAHDRVEDRTR